MKLLLWVALFGAAIALPNFLGRFKGRNGTRFGKLSEEKKASLKQAWSRAGVDPEARKTRLANLSKRFGRRELTEEQKAKIKEKQEELNKFRFEKPNENETVDLFEVNEREGMADYLFQGDMFLTDDQLSNLEGELSDDTEDQKRSKRQASTVYRKWTGNTVYYYFDSSLNQRKRNSVAAAIDYITSRTCINFVQSSSASNRVRVFSGSGCYSSIGMVGGQQDLSLGNGCEVIGTAAHEFTHALGVWHTQMRSDRDTYVTIDLSDVDSGLHGNFAKLASNQMVAYTPYEYGSFMHYGANSFTNNANSLSIIPKDDRYIFTMGNRQISFYDIKMINEHYGCSANCPAATSAKCQNGGVPNPRNCNICNCPLGYAGNLCDQRPSGCGETLAASTSWQSKSYNYGDSSDSTNVRDVFTLCNHWITAPAGTQIQVRITSMYNPQCQYGCPFNGIEIKTETEKEKTNPRICCTQFNNVVYNSSLNPTPIISYNRYYYTSFTIQYRYVGAPTQNTSPAVTTLRPTSPTTTTRTTTTTRRTTTTAAAPNSSCGCRNINSDSTCTQLVNQGFCTTSSYNFQTKKYNCAKSCNLCGRAASPCVDQYYDCATLRAQGQCQTMEPYLAEYYCASTCGFCVRPN